MSRKPKATDKAFDSIIDAVDKSADPGSLSGRLSYRDPPRYSAELELLLGGVRYSLVLTPK